MTCESIMLRLPLYLYGELSGEEEEQLEAHLEGCTACAKELAARKVLLRALDEAQPEIPETLLAECRIGLREAVAKEAAIRAARPRMASRSRLAGILRAFAGWFGSGSAEKFSGFRVPIAASALVTLGFFAARFTATGVPEPDAGSRPAEPPALMSAVRSVEAASDGRVRIALDETRRRTVTGTVSDPQIRTLLVAAVRGEDDPRVRLESMELLKANSPASAEIREVLIGALIHDPDEAVRLKAFEGLRQTASDAGTRKAMLYALTADQNSGLRGQAIDMLTERQDRELVGVWQALVERERDPSIRLRYQKVLRAMNASVGTF